jgi:hypothetical protein
LTMLRPKPTHPGVRKHRSTAQTNVFQFSEVGRKRRWRWRKACQVVDDGPVRDGAEDAVNKTAAIDAVQATTRNAPVRFGSHEFLDRFSPSRLRRRPGFGSERRSYRLHVRVGLVQSRPASRQSDGGLLLIPTDFLDSSRPDFATVPETFKSARADTSLWRCVHHPATTDVDAHMGESSVRCGIPARLKLLHSMLHGSRRDGATQQDVTRCKSRQQHRQFSAAGRLQDVPALGPARRRGHESVRAMIAATALCPFE